jgi:hypothetical protein
MTSGHIAPAAGASGTGMVIPAEVDAVFSIVADPMTYPGWLSGAKRIRSVDPGWPAPGTSFHHVVGVGPLEIRDTTTSRAVDPPRTLTMEVRARPLGRGTVQFQLHDVSAGAPARTLVEIIETPRSPGLRLVRPAVNCALSARNTRSLRRLRRMFSTSQA